MTGYSWLLGVFHVITGQLRNLSLTFFMYLIEKEFTLEKINNL